MRTGPTEAQTQKAIMELLAISHVYALRLNTGAGWAKGRPIQHHSGGAGVADIIAFPFCHKTSPSVLWIECKSPVGRQTPEQANFAKHVEDLAMYYLLARSVDDVARWLNVYQ